MWCAFISCSRWAKMHPVPTICSPHAAPAWKATSHHLWIDSEFWLPRPELVAALAGSLCARRSLTVAGSSKSATVELLVDADQHGIDDIKEAIQLLQNEGEVVHTQVFAPPGRSQNKRWARFMKKPGVSFEPAPLADSSICMQLVVSVD